MALGTTPQATPHRLSLFEAKGIADALPDLLVEARRIAMTVLAGWHGRRRSGPGETFWQFRTFMPGEAASSVDWRRSARDEHLYVREKEWEAVHTVWLWTDLTASMKFQSRLASASKRDRAVVLTLALAELLAAGGERIGIIGGGRPILSRHAAERVAETIAHMPEANPFETTLLRRFTDVVLIGDFLDPLDQVEAKLAEIAAVGARAHLVQVLDPVEETFPYSGRTEFQDPETGTRHVVGRAEQYKEAYEMRLAALRDRLGAFSRRLGWTFLIHRTDRPANEPLLALHTRLTERLEGGGRAADGRAA